MKRKITLILTATAISFVMMTGCSSSSGSAAVSSTEAAAETEAETAEEGTETESTDTESAGAETTAPWVESDKEGVLEATGLEISAPEGASDAAYAYLKDEKVAQVTYVLDDIKWTYRMKAADTLTDLSDKDQEWLDAAAPDVDTDENVSGREAKYYGYVAEGEADIQIADWYDAVTGTAYSLTAEAEDLDGIDMQYYAENVYEPLQGDATDDAEKDRENELKDYFIGRHESSYDGSTLTISDNNDGTFNIDISIFRLCDLENGTATFENHKLNFEAEDPNGEKLSGMIYRDSDNSLTVKITDSSWELLPKDETFEGFGR